MKTSSCRVAIIGGGPSGLALAAELARGGIDDVVLLEREANAGGIPRHCGHSPFGLREFHRILSGPEYARRLASRAQRLGTRLRTAATVTEIGQQGNLTLSTVAGIESLIAEKIVICTGNRETPRAARLVSGSRPLGIVTTGALQSMVYLKHRLPFTRPLIVGSELVSFSALLTCRHAGIKPVAMIDSHARVIAWRGAALLPRLLGTRLLLNASLQAIHGEERVTEVTIRDARGDLMSLECDGVIFSGNFVSESSLVRASHLELDAASGGPRVDQYGRCSDEDYFACGNMLHPVDTAAWCWAEGAHTAAGVHASLAGRLNALQRRLQVNCGSPAIRYFMPQVIALPHPDCGTIPPAAHDSLQVRFNDNLSGRLALCDENGELSARNIRARRERRVLLPLPAYERLSRSQSLSLEFQPTQD
ncbi:MAG: NAD(P)/FAD-dependent oxidoreductase [Gammaproteobacteria bacterium]|nr:NAD(P)/FAD-dependent oxidoreductase [Gammaproteobacteria bacterium]